MASKSLLNQAPPTQDPVSLAPCWEVHLAFLFYNHGLVHMPQVPAQVANVAG